METSNKLALITLCTALLGGLNLLGAEKSTPEYHDHMASKQQAQTPWPTLLKCLKDGSIWQVKPRTFADKHTIFRTGSTTNFPKRKITQPIKLTRDGVERSAIQAFIYSLWDNSVYYLNKEEDDLRPAYEDISPIETVTPSFSSSSSSTSSSSSSSSSSVSSSLSSSSSSSSSSAKRS